MENISFQQKQEIPQENKAEIDLQKFGIEKDRPIPLSKLVELIRANESEISEGIKRHFYWQLKLALFGQPRQYPSGGNWSVVGKMYKGKNEPHTAKVTIFLGGEVEAPQYPNRFNQPRIEFLFSADEETAEREIEHENNFGREFTSTESFRYDGALVGVRTKRPSLEKTTEELLNLNTLTAEDLHKLETVETDSSQVIAWLEAFLKPEDKFKEASQEIIRLTKEFKLNPTEAKNLVLAIRDFGNYMYNPKNLENGKSAEGDCLTIPHSFKHFCSHKYKINIIDTPHYGERLVGEDAPDGSEMGYEPYDFYHVVNVFGKKVVIDWTVSQFKKYKNTSFPYVYGVGDKTKFGGQLYKEAGKTNEPYL